MVPYQLGVRYPTYLTYHDQSCPFLLISYIRVEAVYACPSVVRRNTPLMALLLSRRSMMDSSSIPCASLSKILLIYIHTYIPRITADLMDCKRLGKRTVPDAVVAAPDSKRSKAQGDLMASNVDFINEYRGFSFDDDSSREPQIDRIPLSDLTPESFYEQYISQRKPCVVIGTLDGWKVPQQWTSTYLKSKAGNVQVTVEKRESDNAKFGKGNEVKLSFGEFLDILDDKKQPNSSSSLYYLTTQDVQTVQGGRPDVMSPFMKQLAGDFPLRPAIMGNLIPQNINLWMGNSPAGSSSGLHHDYHDNLYLLVQGHKRFDLYAPSDAPYLYTRGQLLRIHPNGRINYVGEDTCADGSHPQAAEALDASLQQEAAAAALQAAEEAVERGEEGAQEQLEKAELALDRAMEAVMDAEVNDESDGNDSLDEAEEADVDFWQAIKREQSKEHNHVAELDEQTKGILYDCALDSDLGFGGQGRLVDKTVKNPLNFSRVDTILDKTSLKTHFPLFEKARKASVDIAAGEMLFLPASWFHEVTSFEKNMALSTCRNSHNCRCQCLRCLSIRNISETNLFLMRSSIHPRLLVSSPRWNMLRSTLPFHFLGEGLVAAQASRLVLVDAGPVHHDPRFYISYLFRYTTDECFYAMDATRKGAWPTAVHLKM